MGIALVTAPLVEPVSLGEAKAHIRADDIPDEDGQVAAWITTARIHVERESGWRLITQTWDYAADAFPVCRASIVLPLAPLLSVGSVTWYDDSDVATVVSPSTYAVDAMSSRPRIALRRGQAWPSGVLRPVNGVVVRATFGFGPAGADVAKVAAPLLAAMLLLIGHFAANREAVDIGTGSVTSVPLGFDRLVALSGRVVLA